MSPAHEPHGSQHSKLSALLEWSSAVDGWEILGGDATIDDDVLATPLAIRDLVSAGSADEAVARALFAKRTPFVERALEVRFAEGEAKGYALGRAESIVEVLAARGLAPVPHERERILATVDEHVLTRWLTAALTCTSVAELIATTGA